MSIIKEMNDIRRKFGSGLINGTTTFLVNSLCYVGRVQPRRGPLYVGWDITFRCNAKCIYCDRWKIKKNELTTMEALKIIKELGDMRVWMISFNGGEPLLRKDIGILIKAARKMGILVDINTNGFLLKRRAKELIEAGINTISVSVESDKAKEHDKIRNCKGLFDALEEGINETKKLNKNVIIKVRANVGKNNYKNLRNYIDSWKNKVDEIVLQPIHECEANFFKINKDLRFNKSDEEEFKEEYLTLIKEYKMGNLFYKEFPSFFFNKQDLWKRYLCFAGSFYIQIDPEGNVHPCNEYIKKVGNLKEKSFKNIWFGKKIKEFRKLVRQHKNKCMCWYNCNGTLNCYLTKTIGKI